MKPSGVPITGLRRLCWQLYLGLFEALGAIAWACQGCEKSPDRIGWRVYVWCCCRTFRANETLEGRM